MGPNYRQTLYFTVFFCVSCAFNYQLELSSSNGFQWRAFLSNRSIEVEGRVPGSIYTDLYNGGVLAHGPLFYRLNDLNYRWVSFENWTYSLEFDVESSVSDYSVVDLVFNGVDTVARIALNDVTLGSTNNMFVRYKFDVKSILRVTRNVLTVDFQSPVEYAKIKYDQQALNYPILPTGLVPEYQGEDHANHIRKMQSSFSWDWGPAFPTIGLWHTVQLEAHDTVVVRDVSVETARTAGKDFWIVTLALHCETPDVGVAHDVTFEANISDSDGSVLIAQGFSVSRAGDENREFSVKDIQFIIPANKIDPWMPNGFGNQTLYSLTISYVEQTFSESKFIDRIGFRTVELVQDPLPDGRTYYFKINEEPVFLTGSNWIPAQVLPELVTVEYLRELLTSAKDAHMNSLRIWGGGIYEFDEFYQIADELGITIWHDMMFACSMYPADGEFLTSVRSEIRQQVRRLNRHPSIIIWAGNNENEAALRQNWYGTQSNFEVYKSDYIALYVDTIRSVVTEEDRSRPFTVSSPSNGLKSEQDGYVSNNPGDERFGDVHYYNYFGESWNWTNYPKPRMATEYGFQSLPSVHAWAEAARPIGSPDNDDWHYDGEMIDKRQHHPGGNRELVLQVNARLGAPRNQTPEQQFIDMIYLTQMHQAESIKIETEHYRRMQYLTINGLGQTMGALYWQLQDIWQGPSWASIEYGGRWKPLHYFAVKFFSPVSFMLWVLDGNVNVYPHWFRNGALKAGTLNVQLFSWASIAPITDDFINVPADTPAGFSVWNKPLDSWLADNQCTRQTCLLVARYTDNEASSSPPPDSYLFLDDFPAVANLQKANVQVVNVIRIDAKSVSVVVSTDHIAAFVWLDTKSDRKGRFSDNGFLLTTASKSVTFQGKEDITDLAQFQSDLTVNHLAQIIL